MGAISALSTTGRTLKRNGVLFAAAFVIMLVSLIPSGISAVLPPAAAALASMVGSGLSLLLTPFFTGGILSMAYEGLDGTTGFDTFVSGGKDNYVRLLGSMLLFSVLISIIGFTVLVVGAVIAIFVVGTGVSGAEQALTVSGGNFAILVVVGLLGALAFLLPVLFFQFYAPAIVVSDLDIGAAFKRSALLVRRNFVSTLGYLVVAVLVGLVSGISGIGVSVVAGGGFAETTNAAGPELSLGLLAIVAVLVAVVSTVVSAFGSVYQVAFYDDCLDSVA
ncbi:DUF7847 domain-containing protein [Halorussus pelagicus]|uniref:DUF7847 domain-containing protein n=1 Tax=Halorussus pelagicus TaxID=2505977 RepID=UPI000FFC33B8|nr:hypothetical protein [Halorussus pelagicus]